NLERAFDLLRPLEDLSAWRRHGLRGSIESDVACSVELELHVERLRCADESGEQTLEGLVFRGTLALGPDETRLELEGGDAGDESLHAKLVLQRLEIDPPPPWKMSFTLSGAPTVLARVACTALRPLASALGTRTDALDVERDGDGVTLHVEDDGATLDLA